MKILATSRAVGQVIRVGTEDVSCFLLLDKKRWQASTISATNTEAHLRASPQGLESKDQQA